MSGATAWQGRRIACRCWRRAALCRLWIALLVFRELTLAVILSTPTTSRSPVVVWSLWLAAGSDRLRRSPS